MLALLILEKKLRTIKLKWSLAVIFALSFFWAEFPTVSIRVSIFILLAWLLINAYVIEYGPTNAVRIFSIYALSILLVSFLFVCFFPSYGIAVGTEHEGKWQGLFDHKNSLGNFSAMAYVFFAWQFQERRQLMPLCSMLLSLVLVAGSQSAAAIGNVLITSIVLMLMSTRLRNSIYASRSFGVILLVALSFVAIYVSIEHQEFSIFEKNSTFSNRNLIWAYILMKMQESPWLGFGLDQLAALTNLNSAEFFNSVGFLVGTAHNGFLETMFAIGYVGLAAVIFFMIDCVRQLKQSPRAILLFTYLVSFCILNTFESKLLGFNVHFVGLLLLLASNAYSTKDKAAPHPARSAPFRQLRYSCTRAVDLIVQLIN